MWLMLQQERPEDYVIGSGETHSVQEFVQVAFEHADLDWGSYVKVDPAFIRPAEVEVLLADPSKGRRELNWQTKVSFRELVVMMVEADLQKLSATS